MKMKIRASLICLMILIGTFSLPTVAAAQASSAEIDKSISDNVGDPAKFKAFFANLKQAVEKHDAAAVAAVVSYPITVNQRTKAAVTIRTPQSFITRYDQIITPHIADVIQKQKYEDLFVNYQGAMLGSGEVWIAGICKDKACKQSDIRIRTIQNTAGNSK
ncbi:MAG TPA: hypothetical protein VK608_15180 [Edaphobacter sp.]|nr:hypothetical protein [Edaphobacter sp.]